MPKQGRQITDLEDKILKISDIKDDAKKDIISFIKNKQFQSKDDNDEVERKKTINTTPEGKRLATFSKNTPQVIAGLEYTIKKHLNLIIGY